MPGARWKRHVTAALTERLGYKAVALFFAVALWLLASGEETAAHYVTVRFVPVLDSSVRLVGAPPRVRALVAGPTRELLKLYAVPPALRHAFGAGTPDEVRVDLRPSDVDLPAAVERVTVRDVQPRVVMLHFAPASDVRPPTAPAAVAAPGTTEVRPDSLPPRPDTARPGADSAARRDTTRRDTARRPLP